MSEILVSVKDQLLKITKAPTVASGGLNEANVIFAFSEQWDGFIKTAVFYRDTDKVYYAVLDENDTCLLPWEVCTEDGSFYFSVFGEKDDIRRTSTIARYKVSKGLIVDDMMPSDPTPEVYDQIIAMVEKTVSVATDMENKRDSGYFKGDTPVCGVDYWTETDKAQIIQETEETAIGFIDSATEEIIKIQEALVDGGDIEIVQSAHIYDTNNPHNVTAEQVGAAPASGFESWHECENTEALNAKINELTVSQPFGTEKTYYIYFYNWTEHLPGGRWSVTIHKPEVADPEMWASVTATVVGSKAIYKLQRELYEGAWLGWEWENPPMLPGVLYKTTERFNGEYVYTVLIDCGKMPNNTYKSITHNIEMHRVIRFCGCEGTSVLPVNMYDWTTGNRRTITIDVSVSTTAVYIKSNYDASANSGMVQVWFTRV